MQQLVAPPIYAALKKNKKNADSRNTTNILLIHQTLGPSRPTASSTIQLSGPPEEGRITAMPINLV